MAAPLHIQRRNREEETQTSVFDTRKLMVTAANMRKEGYSYPHIAGAIGVSRSYAEKLVRKALREIIQESSEDLLKQELSRLDSLFLPAFLAATRLDAHGNPIFDKEATDTALKLMERRSKFLGLDKPVKTELSGGLNIGNTVQVYLPDNGRGLPEGLIIENGEVVRETLVEDVVDLTFDEGDAEFDFGELGDPHEEEFMPFSIV